MLSRIRGINAIYLMHAIQGFGASLIWIFIPIYFLILGYTLAQVLVYLIIYYAVCGASAFLAIWIAKHTSLQWTIVIRYPLVLVFLGLIFLLDSINIPLFVIAIAGGLQNSIYWVPLNILFARHAKENKMGEAVGKLIAFPKILTAISPLIGGFIMVKFGFNVLAIIAFAIFLISIIPLARTKTLKTSFVFKFSEGVRLFKKYPKIFWAEMFDSIGGETRAYLWPIFIYLSLFSIEAVGAVSTLMKITSILFILFVGKMADRFKKTKIIKFASILLALLWISCYFFQTEAYFYVISIIISFAMIMFVIPFTSLVNNTAKKDNLDEFFVFDEIPMAIGRIIIMVLALIVATKLEISFIIAGLSYLYFLFL
ncbi:MAG: hypothetical protein V1865_02550 [bacterium]